VKVYEFTAKMLVSIRKQLPPLPHHKAVVVGHADVAHFTLIATSFWLITLFHT
jgi:hypothetical protein